MPKLFTVSGYTVYFWADEGNEPIHVHVAKGKPSKNATKFWLTRDGKCVLAHNNSRIQKRELAELEEFIAAQFFLICRKWQEFFIVDTIRFYE